MALSTSVNWISNFIVAFITPPLFSALEGGYYFLLLGFTVISGICVYFLYPETAGKTLEQLGEVFGDHDIPLKVEEPNGVEAKTVVAEPISLDIPSSNLEASSEITLSGPEESKPNP